MPAQIHTFICSDVHLGSILGRAKDLTQTLEGYTFDQLILLGDIFHGSGLESLSRDQRRLFDYIQRLPVKKIWVRGNHDPQSSPELAKLLGSELRSEYRWEFQGKTHIATHGHVFDIAGVNDGRWSDLASFLFLTIQRLDFTRNKRFCYLLDRIYTKLCRLSEEVEKGALGYATKEGAHYIYCGHTHVPLTRLQNGVTYINTGSWVRSPVAPTYVVVSEENGAELRRLDT
jgi:predicted phosphodiesterase